VEGPRALRLIAAPAAALVVLGTAACGGGASQGADEPSGTYRVAIVRSSFPTRQHVAAPTRLVIDVRNTGRKTVPDVAVTVDDPDGPPEGSTTAYTDTWALGPLAAGETKRFVWRLTPVQPGTHRLRYRVAAGLAGQAKAVLAGDRVPERELTVRISGRPASARVDPETGAVVRGR